MIMADKIKVFTKRPGMPPRSVWMVNSLRNLQNHVGGYIETFTLAEDMTIICNEEGRIRGLPYNCGIAGVDFFGDIIFAGIRDDEFADVPLTMAEFKALFRDLWEDSIRENAEHCICCDEIIPEGRQVCPACERGAGYA